MKFVNIAGATYVQRKWKDVAKEKKFKFTDNKEINEEITSMSWKKAVKSFQNRFKTPLIFIEWISKKGQEMTKWQKLPIGRKDKIGK